jgi:hypothetical protein
VPTLGDFLDRPDHRFAPWLAILDVHSEEVMNVRLFGTRLVDSFGEITGLNFLDFLQKDLRPIVGRAHKLICTIPCGWVTHARAVTTGGREVVPETITLPLLRHGTTGCVVKLTHIVHQLDYREGLVTVDKVHSEHWIDLGAGVPSAAQWPPRVA